MLATSVSLMRDRVPRDAVVGSPELWAAIPLVTGVRAVPSARFRPLRRGGEPIEGTPSEQLELWAAAGVGYIVTEADVHDGAFAALEAACPGAPRTLDRRAGVSLVRLDWDEDCQRRVRSAP